MRLSRSDLEEIIRPLSKQRRTEALAMFDQLAEYAERRQADARYWQRQAEDARRIATDLDRYARSLEGQIPSRSVS